MNRAQLQKLFLNQRPLWIILAVAGIIRLIFCAEVMTTPYFRIASVFVSTDMHLNLQWAEKLMHGDWLSHDNWHIWPYWMAQIAPRDVWDRALGNPLRYWQAPLYAYMLAGLLKLTSSTLPWVSFLQIMLGLVRIVVGYRLGRLIFGPKAGIVAAALLACNGPMLAYDGSILRDPWVALLEVTTIWRFAEWLVMPSLRNAAFAGVVAALSFLAKESAVPYIVIGIAAILYVHRRHKVLWPALGVFSIAFLLTSSPLIYRNLSLGLPPLALGKIASAVLLSANAGDSIPLAHHDQAPNSVFAEAIRNHIVSTGEILELLWKSFDGDILRMLNFLTFKIRNVLDPFEYPDNLNVYYLENISTLFWLLPGMGLILCTGLLGLFWPLQPWERLRIFFTVNVALAFAQLILQHGLGRYRLTFMTLLACSAGAFVAYVRALAVAQDGKRCGIALAAATMGALLLYGAVPNSELPNGQKLYVDSYRGRNAEYLHMRALYESDGEFSKALHEFVSYEKHHFDFPDAFGHDDIVCQEANVYFAWADSLKKTNPEQAKEKALKGISLIENNHMRTDADTLYAALVKLFQFNEPDKANTYRQFFLEEFPQDPRAAQLGGQ